MSTRALSTVVLLALVPAVAGAWGSQPPPDGTVLVDTGYGSIELWPYTGTDFTGTPSDPVNLFFPDVDPRTVRQVLMGLDGNHPLDLPAPFNGCLWTDAMGSEQVAWAAPERWVGAEIQLACALPGAPLGAPFRVHVRLFRQGTDTLGAAHFEVVVPNTGEHEVLSWDFARLFVYWDIYRSGLLAGDPKQVALVDPGYFRSVLLPVYEGLEDQAGALLAGLGLSKDVVDEGGNPRIPTSGMADVLPLQPVYEPTPEWTRTEFEVEYDVDAPKPFCSAGENDFVHLFGPVRFVLTIYVDAAGRYFRYYEIDGELLVTPIGFPSGSPAPAVVKERHAAYLADRSGQLYERGSRRLLSDPPQSLAWKLAAGVYDAFGERTQCGP